MTTIKFNKGDKLVVTDASGLYASDSIKLNDIVTCLEDYNGIVTCLEDYNGGGNQTFRFVNAAGKEDRGYYARRFTLVTPHLDLTLPIETTDGVEVTLIATSGRGEFPLMGYVGSSTNLNQWAASGSYYNDASGSKSGYDLRNVPAKPATQTFYHNVYKRADGTLRISGGYDTVARAEQMRDADHVGIATTTAVVGEYAQ